MTLRTVLLLALVVPALGTEATLERIEASGRVLLIGADASERLRPDALLAPGDAPRLRFRYLDGKRRHRFGDLNLVMDDAGH